MPDYVVNATGFLLGRHRKAGTTVTLSEAQAKYFLPPHDTRLSLPAPVAETPSPAPAKGKAPAGETPTA